MLRLASRSRRFSTEQSEDQSARGGSVALADDGERSSGKGSLEGGERVFANEDPRDRGIETTPRGNNKITEPPAWRIRRPPRLFFLGDTVNL